MGSIHRLLRYTKTASFVHTAATSGEVLLPDLHRQDLGPGAKKELDEKGHKGTLHGPGMRNPGRTARGGVAEWTKAPVLKTGKRKLRGFESHLLRSGWPRKKRAGQLFES